MPYSCPFLIDTLLNLILIIKYVFKYYYLDGPDDSLI